MTLLDQKLLGLQKKNNFKIKNKNQYGNYRLFDENKIYINNQTNWLDQLN
jgi:hypothetical protein